MVNVIKLIVTNIIELSIVTLVVVMLIAIILSVIMQGVVKSNVATLNVIKRDLFNVKSGFEKLGFQTFLTSHSTLLTKVFFTVSTNRLLNAFL